MMSRRFLSTKPTFSRIPSSDFFTVSKDIGSTGAFTGVVTVAFNRPKNLNALTEDMGIEFERLITQDLASDASIRCLILTGADPHAPVEAAAPPANGKKPKPPAFSAGGDLKFLRARTEVEKPARNAETMRLFYSRFLSIRKVPFPTIAAINGHAVGAGACLTLACDIRLMAGDVNAKIGFNFTKLGLTPGMGGSFMLPNLIGHQASARFLLTGDLISAQEAHQLGLILKISDAKSLYPDSLSLARRIASSSPVAVRGVVKTMRNGFEARAGGMEQALWREADTQALCYSSKDMAEGLDAVIEGREPVFKDF
ncbi:hypothetical protein HDU81_003321 [Chytriomyces hyalinus]|nr:hypothetical protein HDU81_003321 [Chytriomyces hyalinus]